MWIVDALNTQLYPAFFSSLLPAAAEQRAVDGTEFILSESHRISPEWRSLALPHCVDARFQIAPR
jgi:hypothetical protein